MKTNLEKEPTNQQKEFQQLWEAAQKQLNKEAKTTEDRLFADFLANNYLDSKSGLITNKEVKESSSVACK